MMKYKILVLLTITFAVFASCASHEKVKKVEMQLYSGDEYAITVGTEGKVIITSSLMPGLEIIGETGREDNSLITLIAVNMIGNWPNGWTQGRYEASGTYKLIPSGDAYYINIIEPLELWEIEKGEIRYFDTYYRNDDGLHKVRQRVDRIREVTRFLKEEKEYPKISGHLKKTTTFGKGFKKLQGAFLFPEYFDRSAVEGIHVLERGEDWDINYTSSNFPENLQELRNSGSLWRDFEEAPQLVLSLYNLDYVAGNYLAKTRFTGDK